MGEAFTPQADFTGIATNIWIGKVRHKTYLSVNEEGTEAAAATAVIMAQPPSAEMPPVEFRADRPFLFLIRDVKHGTILFLGRVTNPKG